MVRCHLVVRRLLLLLRVVLGLHWGNQHGAGDAHALCIGVGTDWQGG